MPCLHCGKALPLFKRLSGGEFCSAAHRDAYQQEYTQLALGRLQQTRFPAAEAPSGDPPKEASSAKGAVPVAEVRPAVAAAPTPRAEAKNGSSPASPSPP